MTCFSNIIWKNELYGLKRAEANSIVVIVSGLSPFRKRFVSNTNEQFGIIPTSSVNEC